MSKIELSGKSVDALVGLITGDIGELDLPYRSGPDLINFFNNFGYDDSYSSGFPSRRDFTREKLQELNGTETMGKVVRDALDPRHFFPMDMKVEEVANHMEAYFRFDGYTLNKDGQFHVLREKETTAINLETDLELVRDLDQGQIEEHIEKCRRKVGNGDFSGAITNARSLIEAVLLGIEQKLGAPRSEYDGKLPDLYKRVYRLMNLDPGSKALDTNLRQILTGLISLIDGLAGIRNRMSDSHAVPYKASRHHAELAVNSANTFLNFILQSYRFQKNQGNLS